ncbi:MAG TPA: hypothetical protein DCS33_12945, partial [Gammaproteobacteria bacterium]|nr:hypothetical protein [Gammaproteobacteria bacterium]
MGLFSLLTLLPAGLLMWLTAWIRSSEPLLVDIRSQMRDPSAMELRRYPFAKLWPVAVILGSVFAIAANIFPSSLSLDPASDIFWTSIAMA